MINYLLKYFTIIVLYFSFAISQEYDVSVWTVPVGAAQLTNTNSSESILKLKSSDLLSYIFPVNIEINSKYNYEDYSVIENRKISKQGSEKQKYKAKVVDGNTLVYDNDERLPLPDKTHSLLSFFQRIVEYPVDSLDTKWFNLVNEGKLYRCRLLWNDSTKISVANKEILCNHYRLDLELAKSHIDLIEQTDYFNETFFDLNSIRQIWIERCQKNKRILRIEIKNKTISLRLKIKS